jgi:hypothetical protein
MRVNDKRAKNIADLCDSWHLCDSHWIAIADVRDLLSDREDYERFVAAIRDGYEDAEWSDYVSNALRELNEEE